MALMRWEPFQEMNSLQRDMNRLFESLSPEQKRDRAAFVPAAEMTDTPEAILLKLEVPGMDAQNIDIQVSAEAVSISGERKSVSRTDSEGTKRSEFRYGSFRRVISLPVRVQNTDVTAEYKDGILHLTLPKAAEEKNKVVKVNVG
ncbi:MAG: Hsp20/alpha crystallin family protein [Cyanophyceae cyanobacterium]